MRTIVLTISLLLLGDGVAANDGELATRETFAARVRTVIESGDVEGFSKMLSRQGLVCNDGIVPASEVVSQLRSKKGFFYALLFDSNALGKYAKSLLPVMSYSEFFRRAKDAKPIIELEWNIVRWRSKTLEVNEAPYLGVVAENDELRIGLISETCH